MTYVGLKVQVHGLHKLNLTAEQVAEIVKHALLERFESESDTDVIVEIEETA